MFRLPPHCVFAPYVPWAAFRPLGARILLCRRRVVCSPSPHPFLPLLATAGVFHSVYFTSRRVRFLFFRCFTSCVFHLGPPPVHPARGCVASAPVPSVWLALVFTPSLFSFLGCACFHFAPPAPPGFYSRFHGVCFFRTPALFSRLSHLSPTC